MHKGRTAGINYLRCALSTGDIVLGHADETNRDGRDLALTRLQLFVLVLCTVRPASAENALFGCHTPGASEDKFYIFWEINLGQLTADNSGLNCQLSVHDHLDGVRKIYHPPMPILFSSSNSLCYKGPL